MKILKTSNLPQASKQRVETPEAALPESQDSQQPAPSESVSISDQKEDLGKPKTLVGKVLTSPVGRVATGVAIGGATGLATGLAGGNPVVAKGVSAAIGGTVGVVAGAGLGFLASVPFSLAKNSSKPMNIGITVGALGGGALGVHGGLQKGEMIAAFGSYLGGGVVGHTAAGALVGGGAALLTLI